MSKHIDPAKIIPCAIPVSKRFNNVAGMRFGRLKVTRFAGRATSRQGWYYLWECCCDCGNTIYAAAHNLKSGKTASCGCLNKEVASRTHTVHGLRDSPEWHVWCSMKARCYNPKTKNFFRYGGRGIRVAASWLAEFAAFYRDMGPRPSPHHSLERRDNNGNYEPSNCYWATAKQQARNRRSNVNLEFNGVTMCALDWDEHLGFRKETVRNRLNLGWTVERALTTPINHHRTHHHQSAPCQAISPLP